MRAWLCSFPREMGSREWSVFPEFLALCSLRGARPPQKPGDTLAVLRPSTHRQVSWSLLARRPFSSCLSLSRLPPGLRAEGWGSGGTEAGGKGWRSAWPPQAMGTRLAPPGLPRNPLGQPPARPTWPPPPHCWDTRLCLAGHYSEDTFPDSGNNKKKKTRAENNGFALVMCTPRDIGADWTKHRGRPSVFRPFLSHEGL